MIFAVPERLHRGDFVLRLTEVEKATPGSKGATDEVHRVRIAAAGGVI